MNRPSSQADQTSDATVPAPSSAGMRRGWEGKTMKNVESLTKAATAHAMRVLEKVPA